MSGVVGICSKQALDLGCAEGIVAQMSQEITYAADDLTDRWNDSHLSIARVHHGIVNSQAQPIFNESGSLCVVMDGEVFDYGLEKMALIDEGHRFGLQENDAEYCLHLYERYGHQAFAKLNGAFVLALYDRKTRELLLVNDRLSSRPVFYYYDGEQLIFGTQLRPLLKLPALPRRLDLLAVFQFLAFQHVLGERTFYQDVRVLPPASVLRFEDGRISFSQYWRTQYRDESHPEEHYVEALASALERAIRRTTRGNHRFGILLSGGLDSRTIVACCDKPLTAFTFGDFENREVRIARRIARACDCRHVFLRRGFDHYPNLLEEAIDIGDGMHRFDHAHALGLLRHIRPCCDILLEAHGFDIRLKGYYFLHKAVSVLGKRIGTPLLAEVPEADSLEVWKKVPSSLLSLAPSGLFNSRCRSAYNDLLLSSVQHMLERVEAQDAHSMIEYVPANSFHTISSHLFVLGIRAHMEQRSVILDNELLDLSLSIPPRFKARGRVLRKALKALSPELAAIPNANTGLRADMPVWPEWLLVTSRGALRKIGILPWPHLPHPAYVDDSWPNMAQLIRYNEKLRRSIEETLHDPECIDPHLFDIEAVDSLLERHLNRQEDLHELLFLLLTFGRWHKKYGPK